MPRGRPSINSNPYQRAAYDREVRRSVRAAERYRSVSVVESDPSLAEPLQVDVEQESPPDR